MVKKNLILSIKKYEDLESMSTDQLINEVIKARVEAERAKKGYVVKRGGPEKKFINLSDLNTKQFINYLLNFLLINYVKL